MAAAGGNPAAYALRYTLYREAVGLLRGGGLALPTHVDGPTIADAIEHWVLEQFVARAVEYTPGDNAYHDALQGYLYEEAVRRLRSGAFRVDGATAAADALDHWVRREFVKRIDKVPRD